MNILTICKKILLPPSVTAQVCSFPEIPEEILLLLRTPGRWAEGRAALAAHPRKDRDGLLELAAHLQCAVKTWDIYRERGISEDIYFDTMKCFTRFVAEHRQSYGYDGFDRGFWTVRQLSAVLFRIGELEYEICADGIHLHIPSDAVLEMPRLRASWERARQMLGTAPMLCHSWLLSPDLPELLDGDSRILAFQRNFTIHTPEPDESFRQWVFKDPWCPDKQLPENTRLQKRLKAFLLSGRTFRAARGILRDTPFFVE